MKNKYILFTFYLIYSIMLIFGIKFLFYPCPPNNGVFMICHNLEKYEIVIGLAILITSSLFLFLKNDNKKMKIIITCIITLESIFSLMIPNLIKLCVMNTMRCNLITKPFVITINIIILIISFINIFCLTKEKTNE